MKYYTTFIVKICVNEAPGKVRGWIQEVGNAARVDFLGFEKMVDFIRRRIAGPPGNAGQTGDDIGEVPKAAGESGPSGPGYRAIAEAEKLVEGLARQDKGQTRSEKSPK